MARTMNGFNPGTLKFALVSGATTGSSFVVTGIAKEDAVWAAVQFNGDTGVIVADLTSETTVPYANRVNTGTTDTSSNTMGVFWVDVSGASEA